MKLKKEFYSLAYCAGIVDGEGTICIVTRTRGSYISWRPVVAVQMTQPESVRALKETFGGKVFTPPKKTKGGRQIYMWVASGEHARLVCLSLLPFLLIKKKQASLLVDFVVHRSHLKNSYLSQRDKNWCNRMAKKMSMLNA